MVPASYGGALWQCTTGRTGCCRFKAVVQHCFACDEGLPAVIESDGCDVQCKSALPCVVVQMRVGRHVSSMLVYRIKMMLSSDLCTSHI
jgi:hypothetical protein